MQRRVIVWVLGVFVCSVSIEVVLSSFSISSYFILFENVFLVNYFRVVGILKSHIAPLFFFCSIVLVSARAVGGFPRGIGKSILIACSGYLFFCILHISLDGILVSSLMLGGQFGDQIIATSQESTQAIFWAYFLRYSIWTLAYCISVRLVQGKKTEVGKWRFIATCVVIVGCCVLLSFCEMKEYEEIASSNMVVLGRSFWMVEGLFNWEWALKLLVLTGVYSWGVLNVKPFDSFPPWVNASSEYVPRADDEHLGSSHLGELK